jgi:hypothetical protein
MDLNHRCLGVGQESLPLDHGTEDAFAGAGIEPTSRRSERLVLPLDDPALITRDARGEGLEPSFPASKAGGLPLADPQVNLQSALRESNSPVQLGRLAPLPIGQEHA